ncbi:MAG: tetratricopeptide repeat protein [Acidobacteria bacterium]|nr:tetratricopeptide repeat protein [Acidobacteriota bacterium]
MTRSVVWIALLLALLEARGAEGQPSPPARLEHAVALIAEARYAEAQQILEQIAGSLGEASGGQVHYHLAVCHIKQRQWTQAEEALKISFQRSAPTLPGIFMNAFVLFHRGRYNESLAAISGYLEKDPGNAEAHKVKGLSYFMLGRQGEAEAELKRAAALDPRDSDSFYYLGRIFFSRSNMPGALASFEQAIRLSPDSVRAYNHLGQTLEGLADFPAARDAYLKAIALEQQQPVKSQWPYFNLGGLYIKEGQAREAIGYLRQALARNPAWAEGKIRLAVALSSTGQCQEALALLDDVIRTNPKDADAHYQLSRVLRKIGRRKQAEEHALMFETLRKPKLSRAE